MSPPDAIAWMRDNGYFSVGTWYPDVQVIAFAFEYMAYDQRPVEHHYPSGGLAHAIVCFRPAWITDADFCGLGAIRRRGG